MLIIFIFILILILISVGIFFYCKRKKKQHYIQKFPIYPAIHNIEFDTAYKEMSKQEQFTRNNVPKWTKSGFKLLTLSDELDSRLKNLWNSKKHLKELEMVPENDMITGTKFSKESIIYLLDINKYDLQLKSDLEKYILQQLQEWTGLDNLIHSATYGIREYKRGAVLKVHCDRYDTHVISAIINITHKSDKPWPLTVWDYNDNKHDVYLDDKINLVLYESIALMHGRPYPFKGDSFVNIFLHFKLPNWKKQMDELIPKNLL